MENNNNSSGTNTILIVIVIIILVALGVWWYVASNGTGQPADNGSDINVDLNLPEGENGGGGANAGGAMGETGGSMEGGTAPAPSSGYAQ